MSETQKGAKAMTEDRKTSISEGRKRAKEQREAAEQLFEQCGGMLISWKFWKKVDAATREEILKAIKKANKAVIDADIRALEKQLAAMRAAKDGIEA
jgi:hypothetical protein